MGPAGDRITFSIKSPPVSFQARRKRKDALYKAVRAAMGNPNYLLSGDVAVTVTWSIQERLRYETNTVPDLDNTLKVLIDALCGPEGMMVNDTQVQSIHYDWEGWESPGQEVKIELRFVPEEWIPKDGLSFVRFSKNLCWPTFSSMEPDAELEILDSLEDRLRLREAHGYNSYRRIASVQRPWHSAHLRGFKVEDIAVVKRRLQAKVARAQGKRNSFNTRPLPK